MNSIKLILFDLGNVIFPYSNDPTAEYWSKVSGCRKENILKEIDFNDYEYCSFERGEIPSTRFRKYVSTKMNCTFSDADFDRGWNAMFTGVTPRVKEMLEKLRNEYLLAALSNTNEIHERHILTQFPQIIGLFDRLFFSNRIHIRKPEKEAFDLVLNYYKILPGEVLFLDDKQENTDKAKNLGMKIVLVRSEEDIFIGLKDAGIMV